MQKNRVSEHRLYGLCGIQPSVPFYLHGNFTLVVYMKWYYGHLWIEPNKPLLQRI